VWADGLNTVLILHQSLLKNLESLVLQLANILHDFRI